MTRMWSDSRRSYNELAGMHNQHLLNAYRKLVRGEYRDENGKALTEAAYTDLVEAIHGEFAKRGLDPMYPTGKPPDDPRDDEGFA